MAMLHLFSSVACAVHAQWRSWAAIPCRWHHIRTFANLLPMPDTLYEQDILAWSDHQADLLRRLARGERVEWYRLGARR